MTDPTSPWRRRLIRAVLACYPRPVRQRYGAEIADLLANSPTLVRDLADVLRCALHDQITRRPGAPAMVRARAQARTLGLLVLAPSGFLFATLVLFGVAGYAMNVLSGPAGLPVTDPFPVVCSLATVLAALLAGWTGRRLGRRRALVAAAFTGPAGFAVGLLAVAALPILGEVLGETRSAATLAVALWSVGMAGLGHLLRRQLRLGRTVVARLGALAGGLAVLTLSIVGYVLSAVEPARAPRGQAMYWYLSAVSGIDPGLVDRAHLQLADEVKFLPVVLTACTVACLTLVGATAERGKVVAHRVETATSRNQIPDRG